MDGAPDKPLWIEIRRPDGSVLARRGSAGARLFSSDEESAHFRNREALYKVVPAPGGEAVVEVFPLYASGLAAPPPPTPPASGPSTARRSLVVVEIAAPLVVRDASVIWPIRRNLVINCSGALALLATVVIAGPRLPLLRARPAPRAAAGDRPPGAVRAAPVPDGGLRARPAGDRLQAGRAGERRLLRRVPRRRRPHRDRDGRRLRQGRARRARHGRDPRRRALQRVVGVHGRARAGVRAAEPPAVREGLRRALRQHVLVLLRARSRAGCATSTRGTARRSWSASGATGSRSRVSTPAARCSASFPRRATSRPGATSAPETCSSSTRTA